MRNDDDNGKKGERGGSGARGYPDEAVHVYYTCTELLMLITGSAGCQQRG